YCRKGGVWGKDWGWSEFRSGSEYCLSPVPTRISPGLPKTETRTCRRSSLRLFGTSGGAVGINHNPCQVYSNGWPCESNVDTSIWEGRDKSRLHNLADWDFQC